MQFFVIFNLHLGVGHSVLLQMERLGQVFSNQHIFKCLSPPPSPSVLFDQPPLVKKKSVGMGQSH